jgi:hypothetical protein
MVKMGGRKLYATTNLQGEEEKAQRDADKRILRPTCENNNNKKKIQVVVLRVLRP